MAKISKEGKKDLVSNLKSKFEKSASEYGNFEITFIISIAVKIPTSQ